MRDPDGESALAVDRPGNDLAAGFLLHRHALAREHALVHGAAAVRHFAIGRNPLAGPYQHQVAHYQGRDFYIADFIAFFLVRFGRQQLHQQLQRVRGPGYRFHL